MGAREKHRYDRPSPTTTLILGDEMHRRCRYVHGEQEEERGAKHTISGLNFEFQMFSLPTQWENSPTATCAGVPAKSARPRTALHRTKWSGRL